MIKNMIRKRKIHLKMHQKSKGRCWEPTVHNNMCIVYSNYSPKRIKEQRKTKNKIHFLPSFVNHQNMHLTFPADHNWSFALFPQRKTERSVSPYGSDQNLYRAIRAIWATEFGQIPPFSQFYSVDSSTFLCYLCNYMVNLLISSLFWWSWLGHWEK